MSQFLPSICLVLSDSVLDMEGKYSEAEVTMTYFQDLRSFIMTLDDFHEGHDD